MELRFETKNSRARARTLHTPKSSAPREFQSCLKQAPVPRGSVVHPPKGSLLALFRVASTDSLRKKLVTPSSSPEITHDVVKLVQNEPYHCEGCQRNYSDLYDKSFRIEHVTCPPLFSYPVGRQGKLNFPCRKALVSVLLQSPVWEAEVIRHFVSAELREPAT
jgi:hypothetical protein